MSLYVLFNQHILRFISPRRLFVCHLFLHLLHGTPGSSTAHAFLPVLRPCILLPFPSAAKLMVRITSRSVPLSRAQSFLHHDLNKPCFQAAGVTTYVQADGETSSLLRVSRASGVFHGRHTHRTADGR